MCSSDKPVSQEEAAAAAAATAAAEEEPRRLEKKAAAAAAATNEHCLHADADTGLLHTGSALPASADPMEGHGEADAVIVSRGAKRRRSAAAATGAAEQEPRRPEKKAAAAAAATNRHCLHADADTGLLHTGSALPASADPMEGHDEADAVIIRRGDRRLPLIDPSRSDDGTGSDVRGGGMDGGNEITKNRQEPQDEQEDVLVVTWEEGQALKEQGFDVALIQTWEQANELEDGIRSLRRVEARRKRRAEEYEENQRAQRRRLELGAASEGYDMDTFWQDHCRAKALGAQLREGDDPSNACRADLQLRC